MQNDCQSVGECSFDELGAFYTLQCVLFIST